jgi:hypothetical protein
MDETREPPATPAVRLIFEYDGDDVRLVSQQPVDVALTGFDLAGPVVPGHHYVETRSETDEALDRVPARGAFAASAEVFPEQPGEPITRVDVEKPQGAFTVVVPAGPNAVRAALVRVHAAGGDERLAAATTPVEGEPEVVELASFPLDRGQTLQEEER